VKLYNCANGCLYSYKVGLVLVYATGFVSLTATILALYGNVEYNILIHDWRAFLPSHVSATVWLNIEVCTALTCASMPAISKLCRYSFGKTSRYLLSFLGVFGFRQTNPPPGGHIACLGCEPYSLLPLPSLPKKAAVAVTCYDRPT
jgi:hypothetical protein